MSKIELYRAPATSSARSGKKSVRPTSPIISVSIVFISMGLKYSRNACSMTGGNIYIDLAVSAGVDDHRFEAVAKKVG